MSRIRLLNGELFDFNNPAASCRPDMISIFIQALSRLCRYTGHVTQFYSVAQHSVLVSYLTPPEEAYHGLMHDIAESVLGDVAKPLKELLPDYQRVEKRVEAVFAEVFMFPAEKTPAVELADHAAYRMESNLLQQYDEWRSGPWLLAPEHDLRFKIPPLDSNGAANQFMRRFRELAPAALQPPK